MTDVERILSMSFEEQAEDFRQRVQALYTPEEAAEILDPGPEEDEYDQGPDWRERQADRDYEEHLREQDDRRAVMRGIG